MKLLVKIGLGLFVLLNITGCASLNSNGFQYPKFGLYNASPAPMAEEGHSWNENLSHSEWVDSTSPSRLLDQNGSGPIWH
jgi:hypothetical protein